IERHDSAKVLENLPRPTVARRIGKSQGLGAVLRLRLAAEDVERCWGERPALLPYTTIALIEPQAVDRVEIRANRRVDAARVRVRIRRVGQVPLARLNGAGLDA